MSLRSLLVVSVALSVSAASASCQQNGAVVQPGAPGQSTKVLPADTPGAPQPKPVKADVEFMQGMIMHHNQAVEMVELLRTRSKNSEVQSLGKRISISQTDEMGFMKRWLEERGEPTTMKMAPMDNMPGMDMDMPMMPGMLTTKQMDVLRRASGPEFDHLFLTGMIQHHTGALTMVKQLLDTPGTAQDAVLFDFASDVDSTQQAEIDIMHHLLNKEKE